MLKEFVRLKLEADESMDDMTQDVVLEGAEELGAEWSVLVGRSCANKASANATAAVMRMRLEEIASELSSTLDAPVVLGGQELDGVEEVLPALCPFLNTTNTAANMTKTVSEVRQYRLLIHHRQDSGCSIPWMTICAPNAAIACLWQL